VRGILESSDLASLILLIALLTMSAFFSSEEPDSPFFPQAVKVKSTKVTNSNKITEKHIDDIVEKFTKRENIEYISNLIEYEKIVEENYNLSVSTYVEKEDTSEKIDIVELNKEIQRIVAREEELRKEIDKIIAEIEIK